MQTVCYFFGTFNPIHWGHLLMAETARAQFGFEQIIFIPAYRPPHRQHESQLIPFSHRYEMAQRACQGNPSFYVSDIEALLGTQSDMPTYTIRVLQTLIPQWETHASLIPLILGADALQNLGSWYQAQNLIQHALFLQAPREGIPFQQTITIVQPDASPKTLPLQTQALEMPSIGISASSIRQRIKHWQSIRYFTPQAVVDYIVWNKLYR